MQLEVSTTNPIIAACVEYATPRHHHDGTMGLCFLPCANSVRSKFESVFGRRTAPIARVAYCSPQ